MQIQLKQTEIISALKQYISAQGINLSGKTVEIAFTAGRKEAGLSADISIEDTAPAALNFDAPVEDPPKPNLSVVAGTLQGATTATALIATAETDNVLNGPVAEAKLASEPVDEAPAKVTTSLFG